MKLPTESKIWLAVPVSPFEVLLIYGIVPSSFVLNSSTQATLIKLDIVTLEESEWDINPGKSDKLKDSYASFSSN